MYSAGVKYLCGVLIFVLQFSSFNTFNFNVNAKVEFKPPVQNLNSYFGYSLLLRKGIKPMIIVGAPRDRNDLVPSVTNPGMIYYCMLPSRYSNTSSVLCTPKYVDRKGNERENALYHPKKDNMWLGMTMVGSDYSNGTLVACAPRWINQIYKDYHLANGICYTLPQTERETISFQKLLTPLIDKDSQGFQPYYQSSSLYYYAYGEAGMSMKLSKNGQDLIIGAPGIYSWTGSVIRYRIAKQMFGDDYYVKRNVPNPFYTSDLTESSYFGYSVDMGKFGSGEDSGHIYVAGAPRGADYKGQVILFDFPSRDNAKLLIYTTLEGEQMGEYFGHCLLVVDINNDGLDDLIVGAPLFTQKHNLDQGRVFVYMNNDNRDLQKQSTLIAGDLMSGGRFGSTLANIGDINKDGYTDVAIGAPYEDDGRGAVYIYFGASTGLIPTYAQKITVAGTKGFGISISKGLDMDENGSNDFAVGAHESGQVMLFYGHPFVFIEATMTSMPMEISIHATNFTTEVCLSFTSGTTKSETNITVSLKVDEEYNRASLEDPYNSKFLIIGEVGNMYCKSIVMLINPDVHDYSRPIDVKMEFDLENNPLDATTFCKDCAILHPKTTKIRNLRVPFASGCGDDSICQPDLKLSVDLSVQSPYVVGSSGSILLNISVINTGEPAYLPRVELTPPSNTPLLRVPPKCDLLDTLLSCRFDNPLLVTSKGFVSIELDTRRLQSIDELLSFNITAMSGGDEVTADDNVVNVNITLKSEASITIVGDALMDMYVYLKPQSDVTNQTISHSYEVQNLGPTPLETFKLDFFFPVEYTDIKTNITYPIVNVFEPVDTFNQAPFICKAINGNFYTRPNEGHFVAIDGALEDTSTYNPPTEGSVSQTHPTLSTSNQILSTRNDRALFTDGFDNLSLANFSLPTQIEDDDFPKISYLHINCSDESRVKCLLVQCMKTGGLPVSTNGAHIAFKIMLNLTNIEKILKDQKSIMLSTYSAANNVSDIMVYAYARSLIIGGPPPPKSTPVWIIIVAVICGILLLALISYGLYKCNFFKRKTREELQLLQNKDSSRGEVNDGQDPESDDE